MSCATWSNCPMLQQYPEKNNFEWEIIVSFFSAKSLCISVQSEISVDCSKNKCKGSSHCWNLSLRRCRNVLHCTVYMSIAQLPERPIQTFELRNLAADWPFFSEVSKSSHMRTAGACMALSFVSHPRRDQNFSRMTVKCQGLIWD